MIDEVLTPYRLGNLWDIHGNKVIQSRGELTMFLGVSVNRLDDLVPPFLVEPDFLVLARTDRDNQDQETTTGY